MQQPLFGIPALNLKRRRERERARKEKEKEKEREKERAKAQEKANKEKAKKPHNNKAGDHISELEPYDTVFRITSAKDLLRNGLAEYKGAVVSGDGVLRQEGLITRGAANLFPPNGGAPYGPKPADGTGHCHAFLGNSDNGKSLWLNKLSGSRVPSGRSYSTVGLSMVYRRLFDTDDDMGKAASTGGAKGAGARKKRFYEENTGDGGVLGHSEDRLWIDVAGTGMVVIGNATVRSDVMVTDALLAALVLRLGCDIILVTNRLDAGFVDQYELLLRRIAAISVEQSRTSVRASYQTPAPFSADLHVLLNLQSATTVREAQRDLRVATTLAHGAPAVARYPHCAQHLENAASSKSKAAGKEPEPVSREMATLLSLAATEGRVDFDQGRITVRTYVALDEREPHGREFNQFTACALKESLADMEPRSHAAVASDLFPHVQAAAEMELARLATVQAPLPSSSSASVLTFDEAGDVPECAGLAVPPVERTGAFECVLPMEKGRYLHAAYLESLWSPYTGMTTDVTHKLTRVARLASLSPSGGLLPLSLLTWEMRSRVHSSPHEVLVEIDAAGCHLLDNAKVGPVPGSRVPNDRRVECVLPEKAHRELSMEDPLRDDHVAGRAVVDITFVTPARPYCGEWSHAGQIFLHYGDCTKYHARRAPRDGHKTHIVFAAAGAAAGFFAASLVFLWLVSDAALLRWRWWMRAAAVAAVPVVVCTAALPHVELVTELAVMLWTVAPSWFEHLVTVANVVITVRKAFGL